MRRVLAAAVLCSAVSAQAAVPEGWQPLKINDKKKATAYRLVTEEGRRVLHARAEASASGVYKTAGFSLGDRPVMGWSWKVSSLVQGADNSSAGREDSPARIVLAFEGDKQKLPRTDRAVLRLAHKLSGQNLPYATLMYIWSSEAPVDTLIANPHTRRIQMIVASSGAGGVGAWQALSRNVAADFRRAFNEEPGRLLAYGVLTDTDNTGASVEAWYGDIQFTRESKE